MTRAPRRRQSTTARFSPHQRPRRRLLAVIVLLALAITAAIAYQVGYERGRQVRFRDPESYVVPPPDDLRRQLESDPRVREEAAKALDKAHRERVAEREAREREREFVEEQLGER